MSVVQSTVVPDPIFREFVPLVRPVLPSFDDLAPEIRDILESSWLTKGERLSEYKRTITKHHKKNNTIKKKK